MVIVDMRHLFISADNNAPFGDLLTIGAFADESRKSKFEKLMTKEPPKCDIVEKLKQRRDEHEKRLTEQSITQQSPCESMNEQTSTVEQQDEMESRTESDKNGNQNQDQLEESTMENSRGTTITMMSTIDDFIRNTPFATKDKATTEIDQFLKDIQVVPGLISFSQTEIDKESISLQLEKYESEAVKFDDMIQSICESSNNTEG